MKKLPTAEEFLNSKQYDWVEDINTTECMIEFAKLHVQAALESAAEKLPYDDKLNQDMLVKKSILNAYPLNNIK